KRVILPEKAGVLAVIIEGCIVEIAEHRLFVCVLHGMLVLGCTPKPRLRYMAARAGLAADEGCNESAGRDSGPPTSMHKQSTEANCNDDERCDCCPDPDRALRQQADIADGRSDILRRLGLRCTDGTFYGPAFRGRLGPAARHSPHVLSKHVIFTEPLSWP